MKYLMLIFLSFPVLYELSDDADGDFNKKQDVIWRALLMIVMSIIVHLTGVQNFFISLNMAIALFFFLFDYLIAYVLIRNKVIDVPRAHWFTYTAKKGLFDNMEWWKFSPWIRFGIKLAYFFVSLVLFIKL